MTHRRRASTSRGEIDISSDEPISLLDGLRENIYLLLNEVCSGLLAAVRRSAKRAVPRRRSGWRVDGIEYDAVLWFVETDAPFVHRALLPRFRAAGLLVATSADLELGVPTLVARERLFRKSRRLVFVLGNAKVSDALGDDAILERMHADVCAGLYSILPLYLEGREAAKELPLWLGQMGSMSLNMASYEDGMGRLIETLKGEVPDREG